MVPQHDMVLDNAVGATFRGDLNDALEALVTNSSDALEPTTTYAYQWWADTTAGVLKIRNAANSAWVTVGTLASTNLGLLPLSGGTLTGALLAAAGLVGTPSISFSGDTDTGVYSPGANIMALVAGAAEYLRVSSAGVSFAKNFNGASANDTATGANATITAPTSPLVRLTSGTLTSLDGIPAGQAGQFLVLMNATGVSVTVNDETGGTAANRIRTGSGAPFIFQNNAAVFMIYDSTSARWRMIGGAGGGSRTVATFTGTSVTPTAGASANTFLYTGGSAQSFGATGFGTLSGLTNGYQATLMGSDDANTLSVSGDTTTTDVTDGRLQNGDALLGKGQAITFEYNSTLARMVEISRNF